MNNQKTQVAETLFSATHPYLYKHISVYQILVSTLFAIGGVVAVVFALQSEESDSTFNMALLTLGVLLLLFAIYRFSWKSFETIYQPTDRCYFTDDEAVSIARCLYRAQNEA